MPEPKRIMILYADAGFGHRSAAFAIAEAAHDLYGDQCEVEMINPLEDRRTPAFLRDTQSDYDKIIRNIPDLYKLGFQASDATVTTTLMESGLMVMLFEVMRDIVRRYEPDVIVSTFPLYQAPLEAYFTITSRFIPVFTVVTDLITVHRIWLNNSVDRCLVPTPAVEQLALEAGLKRPQIIQTGIPVHPALLNEKRSAKEIRAELGWDTDRWTALVVGGRRVSHLPEILRVLNHSGLPLQLILVAGGDDELYGLFQNIDWHLPTHLYNYTDRMPHLMHASDMIFCKAGGLVVTESLACGKPMLLVDVLPGQETGNAQYVIENGAGEMGENPVEALESVFHWLQDDGEILKQRAANAVRVGKPRAAYDIAELAWSAATGELDTSGERRMLVRSAIARLLRRNRIHLTDRKPHKALQG